MRTWLPRASKGKARRDRRGRLSPDVFDQPDRSLLGEALGRPIGIGAALILVASAGVFLANHFHFHQERIDDFALVGFFVGGGVLLSMLLRSSDQASASQKFFSMHRPVEDDGELTLDELFEESDDQEPMRQQPGLAEEPAASIPVPPAALVDPKAVKPAPDLGDDEVASFQKALVHYANSGDFHGQGEVLRRLGHLAKGRGHLKESREFYMNARACFRKIDDHYAEAAVLLDLGQVLESLDENDAASAAYRDANRALLDVAMNSSDRFNAVQAHAAD